MTPAQPSLRKGPLLLQAGEKATSALPQAALPHAPDQPVERGPGGREGGWDAEVLSTFNFYYLLPTLALLSVTRYQQSTIAIPQSIMALLLLLFSP